MHAWLPACHLQNPSSGVDGLWRMACEEPCMPHFFFVFDSADSAVLVLNTVRIFYLNIRNFLLTF